MNSEDESWVFWDQSLDDARSLKAFLAAEAARDQGDDIFREFVFRLLEAVHRDKKRLDDPDTIKSVASEVPNLDVDRLFADLDRPELRQRIKNDYTEAVDEHGVFGTPTLLFPNGEPVFLKMAPPPPSDQSEGLLLALRTLSIEQPYVKELKKPRKPERR